MIATPHRDWTDRIEVPDVLLGPKQPTEIGICKFIASRMGPDFKAIRVRPLSRSEAWYFHAEVMIAWERDLFRRTGWASKEHLPFRNRA